MISHTNCFSHHVVHAAKGTLCVCVCVQLHRGLHTCATRYMLALGNTILTSTTSFRADSFMSIRSHHAGHLEGEPISHSTGTIQSPKICANNAAPNVNISFSVLLITRRMALETKPPSPGSYIRQICNDLNLCT